MRAARLLWMLRQSHFSFLAAGYAHVNLVSPANRQRSCRDGRFERGFLCRIFTVDVSVVQHAPAKGAVVNQWPTDRMRTCQNDKNLTHVIAWPAGIRHLGATVRAGQ